MTWIAGADGCRRGWLVVLRDTRSREIRCRVAATIADALAWSKAVTILCVDVPIGLLDHAVPGGRECDRAARAFLGAPRSSSVFSPPARPTLNATSYNDALRRNRASSAHGLGISRQCFAILPKIEEADRHVTPELQHRVVEVHPEVTFAAMNGDRAVGLPKKSAGGRRARLALLEAAWHGRLDAIVEANRGPRVAYDDVLDAMAACWTAERVLRGVAARLPPRPPRDSRGLRMEIVR